MNLFKTLLNSLRCPICKSQIDYDKIYGCASNIDHYVISFIDDFDIPKIQKEIINIYDDKHRYKIIKEHSTPVKITINICDVDAERRVIFSFKELKIVTEIDAFNFDKFVIKKAINRIKTLIVFQ